MNNIKKYPFSELYEMSSGISTTKAQAGHGYPFVSFGTVFNNYFLPEQLPDLMDTSEKEQDIYSIKEGDILITRTSETIDELAMSCVAMKDYPKATYSGFTKRLRPKTTGIAYHKYLAFYLRGYMFRKAVTNNAFMTLRASFNEDIFSFLNLYLPEYQEQVKIGDMLYNMERKIRLNQKICSELEAMAKTLYDYWFVQFDFPDGNGNPYRTSGGEMVWDEQLKREIPKGWETGTIGNLGTIVSGGTPNTSFDEYYCTDGYAWITPNDLSGNTDKMFISHGERDVTVEGIENSSAVLMPKHTVLLSTRAPIGYLAISENEVCTNQGFKSIVPDSGYSEFYIYYVLKSNIPAIAQQGVGTTFKEVSKETLSGFKIPLPPIELTERFAAHILPGCTKRKLLENECKELTKLRDWLMPMLMNGQARVE
jgi:type I restriction enzyme S subunit